MRFIGFAGDYYYVEAQSSFGEWGLRGKGEKWSEALRDLANQLEVYEKRPDWGRGEPNQFKSYCGKTTDWESGDKE